MEFVQACLFYYEGLLRTPFSAARAQLATFGNEPAHFGMPTPMMTEFLASIDEEDKWPAIGHRNSGSES